MFGREESEIPVIDINSDSTFENILKNILIGSQYIVSFINHANKIASYPRLELFLLSIFVE